MGKPQAPEPPDYAAAAREQGAANVDSAVASNYLNQVNQVGPYGSLNYSYAPGIDVAGKNIPSVTATTTLAPDQQKLLDQNNQMSTSLNDLAIKGIGYVGDTVNKPIDLGGLDPLKQSVPQYKQDGTIAASTVPIVTTAGTTALQRGLDFSGAPTAPSQTDYMDARDRITNAMLERMRPEMERGRNSMYTRLANQGINRGSEAYGWDEFNLGRSENDARLAALLAGDQEQQRLFANQMGLRQQSVGETTAQGNFANQASAITQSQNQFNAEMAQRARELEFNQNLARQEAEARARESNFNQGLASAQMANQARAQAIQEQAYIRQDPLNMMNALRSGNQVNMPQFGNVSGGAGIAAAPVYQATSDQYNAQMNAYRAKLAAQGALFGGLGAIGGGLGSAVRF